MRVSEIKPPTRQTFDTRDVDVVKIFLGGSIEMGKARQWQKDVVDALQKWDGVHPHLCNLTLDERDTHIIAFNPRRDDWDSTWETTANNSKFNEQVTWELDQQEKADICVYYFAEDTLSPITLLELGSYSRYKPCVIGADSGYLRLGNLELFCRYHKYDYALTFEHFINQLKVAIYNSVNPQW